MSKHASRNNGGKTNTFGPLAAGDLRMFDAIATELILAAIDAGCTAKISRRGHCILRNAAGSTASVSRSMASANRAAHNARSDIRRLIAEHTSTWKTTRR